MGWVKVGEEVGKAGKRGGFKERVKGREGNKLKVSISW